MIFEFLIAYRLTDSTEIMALIRASLAKVLEDNLNEFDDGAIQEILIPRIERMGEESVDGNGIPFHHAWFGFALDLPEETESLRIVVDEFSDALNSISFVHLVKFEDPLLHADLARWSEEIYSLEMKLRRVLTLIYLHAYQDGDAYELLREESVKPISKDSPRSEHMRERAENQFFHLTFNQYVSLNRRPEPKLSELLDLVRKKESYDGFHEELCRAPIEDEDDSVLLAGLKERMDSIEAMRNCCAHNRRPSRKVEENYLNAQPLLHELLDGYLALWGKR